MPTNLDEIFIGWMLRIMFILSAAVVLNELGCAAVKGWKRVQRTRRTGEGRAPTP